MSHVGNAAASDLLALRMQVGDGLGTFEPYIITYRHATYWKHASDLAEASNTCDFKYLRPAQMEFETTKQPLAGERMGISPTRTGSQQPKNLTQSILLGLTSAT